MENQSEWRAKLSLACYFALVGGILMGSLIVAFVLFGMGVDYPDSPFPIALISVPVNETIILGVTLLLAGYKGASLKKLGLKKVSLRILTIVSVAAVLLFLMGVGISIGEEIVFGPDPMAELLEKSLMPRDSFQMIAMIALSLVWSDPVKSWLLEVLFRRVLKTRLGR